MEIILIIVGILLFFSWISSKKNWTEAERNITKAKILHVLEIEKKNLEIIQEIIQEIKNNSKLQNLDILGKYNSLESDTINKINNNTEMLKMLPNVKIKPNLEINSESAIKFQEDLITQKIEMAFIN